MTNRTIILSAALFVAVVLGMFTYAYLKQQEIAPLPEQVDESVADADAAYAGITRVDAKHFYIDGTHTIVGEILMPTPCNLLESDAVLTDDATTASVSFTVVNTTDVCAQVITPARFMASLVSESAELEWKAALMEREIVINLIEALPGETPEDFELYLKG